MVTYNETETSQETSQSFGYSRPTSSSTSVLDNQLDFTQAMPYTNYSSYQTTTEEDEPVSSYEVEREYNIESLPEDEVIVPTFMPTLNEGKANTVENTDFKLKLNARGKIIACVFGFVACLLVAFVAYNAVVIGKLSSSLAELEVDQVRQSASVGNLETSYQLMTSTDSMSQAAINNGLKTSTATDSVSITLADRPEIKAAEKTTNWFNNICEFLSELFN